MALIDTAGGARSDARADREDPPQAQEDPAGFVSRAWRMPLIGHVVLLVVVLAILTPLARPTVPTPDEGAYGIQAELVAEGRWDYPPPLAHLDPDGTYFPISRAEMLDGRWYPYVKHPLVPAAIAPLIGWFGRDVGVGVFSLAGTIAAAIAAWFLAKELDPRRCRVAFWLAATSPLLVDGFIAGAHTWAAAFAGAAACAVLRIERRGPTFAAGLVLALGLSGGALVRSEGVLWAAALLLAFLVHRARSAGPHKALTAVAAPAAVVGATLWLERRWVSAIVHAGAPSDLVRRVEPDGPAGTAGYLTGRLQGIWHSTFEGTLANPGLIRLLLPAGLLVVTMILLRGRRTDGPAVEVAIAGLAALVVMLWIAHPAVLVSGFLPAAPVVVLGVALALAARRPLGTESLLLGAAALFTVALYATQYADGGAFQWGGRFLTPVVVPLAVVAAGRLRELVAHRPPSGRRPLVGALAALALLSSLSGVTAVGTMRGLESQLYAQIAAAASPVNVTTSELLPRTMWREDMSWLRARPGELDGLLDRVRQAGVPSVTVVAPLAEISGRAAGWPVTERRGRVGATSMYITVLRQ